MFIFTECMTKNKYIFLEREVEMENNSKHLKTSFNKWLIYIYIILYFIIIQSGSVQLSIINENGQSKNYAICLLVLLLPFCIIELKKFKQEYIRIVTVLIFFMMIDIIKYPDSLVSLVMKSLWFLGFIGFAAYWRKRKINIIHHFSMIVTILAIISLILWFAVSILGSSRITFTNYEIADTVYYSWHNLFSYTPFYYTDFMGMNIYRLQGLFWEPGVYQLYLNLAIYHYFFEEKPHENIIKLVILYLNLILTMSTTGLCIGIMLLTIYIINLKLLKKSRQLMILIGGVLACAGCAYFLGQKMLASMQLGWHGSMAARIDDQIVALKLFSQNFLLGAGYDNGQMFLDAQGWGRGCTSGLLSWAYMMGIFGLIAVLYPFIKNIVNAIDETTKRKRMILFMIFVICNLSEPLFWAPLNWYWVASEYVKLFYERRKLNESKWEENSLYWSEIF